MKKEKIYLCTKDTRVILVKNSSMHILLSIVRERERDRYIERKKLLYISHMSALLTRAFLQPSFFFFFSCTATALFCVKFALKIQFEENNEIYT